MNIVLNERDYAIEALERCTLGAKPIDTLGRVAKYYHSEGFKKSDIQSMLEAFILKCDPTISVVKWQNTIDQQVKYASKSKLIEIESVPITQAELDVCDQLDGAQIRRLMFTLICLAKFANAANDKNNGWVNRPDKEIFRAANITTAAKRQSLMLNDLRAAGLVRFSRKVDNVNINVQCLDAAGEAVLHISDFRNLGNQYLRHCGEPYIECASCGLVIKRTSNSQKYCPDCAVEINRQKSRDNFRNSFVS